MKTYCKYLLVCFLLISSVEALGRSTYIVNFCAALRIEQLLGKKIGSFRLPDVDGHMHAIEDYKGKVVLIAIISMNRDDCLWNIPNLVELYHCYQSNDFTVLTLSRDKNQTENVRLLTKAFQIPFPVLLDSDRKATKQFASKRGGIVYPSLILLDRHQRIIKTFSGHIVHEFSKVVRAVEKKMGPVSNTYSWVDKRKTGIPDLLEYCDKNGKCGFMNRQGETIIPARFKIVFGFSEGLASVSLDGKLWGFIDVSGKFVIKPQYKNASFFREGLAPVQINNPSLKKGKRGYIDKTGKIKIAPQFVRAEAFKEGLARVSLDGDLIGFIDRNGIYVIEPRYFNLGTFTKGLAYVQIDGKCGWFNRKGTFAIEPTFKKAKEFSEGLCAVRRGFLWGFINRNGFFEIEPRFLDAKSFSGGLANVKVGSKWGFIDKTGKFVIEPRFDGHALFTFSEGLTQIKIGEKWGYMDTSGRIAIEPRFKYAPGAFHEGLARVNIGGEKKVFSPSGDRSRVVEKRKYGYIDRTGQFVIKPQFEMCLDFEKGGFARIIIHQPHYYFYYIDKTGKRFPPENILPKDVE